MSDIERLEKSIGVAGYCKNEQGSKQVIHSFPTLYNE